MGPTSTLFGEYSEVGSQINQVATISMKGVTNCCKSRTLLLIEISFETTEINTFSKSEMVYGR